MLLAQACATFVPDVGRGKAPDKPTAWQELRADATAGTAAGRANCLPWPFNSLPWPGGGHTIEGNTGSPQGVWQKSITLGAANIWGAIDWPRYWATSVRFAYPPSVTTNTNPSPWATDAERMALVEYLKTL